ncbi:MAG: hypothetical protein AB7O67_17285 [Vicinamibacterales bacterium]
MSDEAPKSAIEIAMERLRQKDAAAGVSAAALSDAQKAEIADVRQVYAARLAQEEILHTSRTAAFLPYEEREKAEQEHRREVDRLEGERDRKIEAIRRRT